MNFMLDYLNNPTIFYLSLVAIGIVFFLFIGRKVYHSWRNPKPRKLTPEEEQRLTRRKRVAEYLADEVALLNRQERWQDNRFTELEAETEAEVETFKPSESWFERFRFWKPRLQPVMVLSEAMEISQERYILLLGDPGGGKSIALRHLALHKAREVAASDDLDKKIPIYINLKELERHRAEQQRQVQRELNRVDLFELLEKRLSESELKTLCFCMNIEVEQFPHEGKSSLARELVLLCDRQERLHELVETCRKRHATLFRGAHVPSESQAIDRHLIEKFVMARLEQGGNRDVDEFLEEDFADEFRRGHLLFLFDSFDELPEVLSSTEEDSTISDYAKAIEGFLRAGKCQGIVASRAYRGPLQTTWPKFRILPLSAERRLELIHKANLKPQLEEELKANLSQATEGLQEMIKNPMFLGLLCEYMKSGETFPQKAHDVFESYIQSRFKRDEARLQRRFAEVSLTTLRQFAENVAFCMTADYELGLSPTRAEIKQAMTRLDFAVDSHFELCLDALEYMRLARSQSHSDGAEAASFTFAHRRFQEYFATCVVLREPERISPEQLLTNGRWRETAVTLCQSQSTDQLTPLLAECRRLLTEMVDSLPDLLTDPVLYVQDPTAYAKNHELKPLRSFFFEWPSQSLHILGLLQQGFWGRMAYLPDDLRVLAARLIVSAGRGSLLDREAGLEVAGIVPEPVLTWLLEQAFASNSLWLQDMAYQQAARLPHITDKIARGIRWSLMRLAWEGVLRREKFTITTHLSRLDRAIDFMSAVELLLWIPTSYIISYFFMIGIVLVTILGNLNIIKFFVFITVPVSIFIVYQYFEYRNNRELLIKLEVSRLISLLMWMTFVLLIVGLSNVSIIILLYVFGYVWLCLVLITVYSGLSTHRIWRPILPIIIPIYFCNYMLLGFVNELGINSLFEVNLYLTIPKFIFIIRSLCIGIARLILFVVYVIILFVVIIIIFTALFYLVINLAEFFWLNLSPHIQQVIFDVYSLVKSTSFFALSVVSPSIIAGWIVIILIKWVKEKTRYQHWQGNNQVMITAYLFLDLISSYEWDRFRLSTIREVHKQSLLIRDKETEIILKNVLVTIEKDRKIMIFSDLENMLKKERLIYYNEFLKELRSVEQMEQPHSEVFTAWYQRYTAKDKYRLGRWSAQHVDELTKLLKQVQAGRGKKE